MKHGRVFVCSAAVVSAWLALGGVSPACAEPAPAVGGDWFVTTDEGCRVATAEEAEVLAGRFAELAASVERQTLTVESDEPGGATIELIFGTDPFSDSFRLALQRAAERYVRLIRNPVHLRVGVSAGYNAGYAAATYVWKYEQSVNYSIVRRRLIENAGPEVVDLVQALPTSSLPVLTLSQGVPKESSVTSVEITYAQGRAWGYVSNDRLDYDATIDFNMSLDWDNDRSDGISPGARDAERVMLHELGHALGFISRPSSSKINTLDFYRFGIGGSETDPGSLAEFRTVRREFRSTEESAIDTVDAVAGVSTVFRLSTGDDGYQPSHWKDDSFLDPALPIGVMDPSSGTGYPRGLLSTADRLALALIGWRIDVAGCPADLTSTHTNPGDFVYGVPDGVLDGADLSFFIEAWLGGVADVADLNTRHANPGEAEYGWPDAVVDGADLSYFVEAWLAGCG